MKLSGLFTILTVFFMFFYIIPASAQDSENMETTAVSSETHEKEAEKISDVSDIPEEAYIVFQETKDLIVVAPQYVQRSFDDVFPGFSRSQKRTISSSTGLRHSYDKDGSPSFIPASGADVNLQTSVMRKNPSHIVEAIVLVPYNKKELDILDIYNSLGRIEHLKDQTLHFRNGNTLNVFKDTTRIISASNRRAIPDPEPARILPYSETMYLRFTDNYIGSIFLRGDITQSLYGITYNMTNFRDINFSIFRIMQAERVSINLYLEPVKEGILIYSMSGIYLPDFIMDKLNLTTNINNRITVLINWITEGLREQEAITRERKFPTAESIMQNEGFNRLINN